MVHHSRRRLDDWQLYLPIHSFEALAMELGKERSLVKQCPYSQRVSTCRCKLPASRRQSQRIKFLLHSLRQVT